MSLTGEWRALILVGASTTTYADQSVLRDQTYTYRVRAVNGAGASAYRSEASVTVTCKTKGKSLNCQ